MYAPLVRPKAQKSGCLCVNMRFCALMPRGALLGNTLNNELTFTKTIFNDIFHINTKSVLFELVPHGCNGLIDSLRVIFNDYDTDNMKYARMLLRF